jgi:hypothetical protein
MLADKMFGFVMGTDFNSTKNVVVDWTISLLTLAFGIYAWMEWSWSFTWVIGGVLCIVVSVFRPLAWAQRRIRGMIKRPSN